MNISSISFFNFGSKLGLSSNELAFIKYVRVNYVCFCYLSIDLSYQLPEKYTNKVYLGNSIPYPQFTFWFNFSSENGAYFQLTIENDCDVYLDITNYKDNKILTEDVDYSFVYLTKYSSN